MSIPHGSEEINLGEDLSPRGRFASLSKLYTPLVIVLVATLSFGLGRLSVGEKREGVRIEYDQELISNTQSPISKQAPISNVPNNENSLASGEVVASKNSDKYHYLHCSGAKRIKEENKLYFATPQAAEVAGYTLAGNCQAR